MHLKISGIMLICAFFWIRIQNYKGRSVATELKALRPYHLRTSDRRWVGPATLLLKRCVDSVLKCSSLPSEPQRQFISIFFTHKSSRCATGGFGSGSIPWSSHLCLVLSNTYHLLCSQLCVTEVVTTRSPFLDQTGQLEPKSRYEKQDCQSGFMLTEI